MKPQQHLDSSSSRNTSQSYCPSSPTLKRKQISEHPLSEFPSFKKQNTTNMMNTTSSFPLEKFIEERINENLDKFDQDLKNGSCLNIFKCVNDTKTSKNGIYMQYPGETHVYKTFFGFLSLVDMLRVAGLNSIDDLFVEKDTMYEDLSIQMKILQLCTSSHNARNGISMIIIFQIIYQLTHFLISERKAALEYMAECGNDFSTEGINYQDIVVCSMDRVTVTEYEPSRGEYITIALRYNQYQKDYSHKIWNSEREAVEVYNLGKLLFELVSWHHIDMDSWNVVSADLSTISSTTLSSKMVHIIKKVRESTHPQKYTLFEKVFSQWSEEQFQKELSSKKNCTTATDYSYFNNDVKQSLEWLFGKAQQKYYADHVTSVLKESVIRKTVEYPRKKDPFSNSSSIFQFFASKWKSPGLNNTVDIMIRGLIFSKTHMQEVLLTLNQKKNPILQKRYIKSILTNMLDRFLEVPSQPLMDGYDYYSLFPNLEFFNRYSYLCRALSSLLFPIPSLRLKLDHWSFVELPQFISSYSSVTSAMEKGIFSQHLKRNPFFIDANSNGTFMTALSQYGVADFDTSVVILKNIAKENLRKLKDIVENKEFVRFEYKPNARDEVQYGELFDSESLRFELLLQELILCYSYMGKGLTEQKEFKMAMRFSEHSLKSIVMTWILLTKREQDYGRLPQIIEEIAELSSGSTLEPLQAVVEECKIIIKENYGNNSNVVVPNWFISTMFTVAYIYDHIEKFDDAVEIYSHVVNICPTYSMAFNNRGICKYRISTPNLDFNGNDYLSSVCEELSFYDYSLSSALDFANVCPQVNRVCLLNIQANLSESDRIENRVNQMISFYVSTGYNKNIFEKLSDVLNDETEGMDVFEFWSKDRKERLISDLNFCTLYKPTDTISDISEHLFDRSVNYQSLDMFDHAINDLTWCEELCKQKITSSILEEEGNEDENYFGGFPNFKSFKTNLLYNRAVCYDAVGKYREAVDDLYKLLEIDSNDTDARMILEELLEATNIPSRVC